MIRAALRMSSLPLALLLLLSLIATPTRAASTRVVGQVIDAESLKPIADADVELQNAGGGPGYHRTRTNANGEFALDGVTTERYYLFTVGAEGYADWALESWQFPAAQREVRVSIPLDKAGRLEVHVSAADGKSPVTAARVTIRSERSTSWWASAQRGPEPRFTGRDGAVTFAGLTAGDYTVQVEAAGLRADEARKVPVRRGEGTPVAITMTRPASIAGAVRLADSTGVAGVNVVARGPGEATATTDAGGFYALGDLAPGRWRVEVQHDGFQPGSARDGLVLREGESRDGVNLRATPKPQAFSFVLQREVFGPDEPQRIGLRAFRVGEVALTLYQLPAARLLDPARDFRATYVTGTDTTGLVRVDAWTHALPEGPAYAWREQDMKLPRELGAGAYVLVGRAGALQRRQLFFVSDLSLLVKRSATQTLVWAGSIKTGLPLKGVSVFALPPSSGEHHVGEGRDWARGLADARGARWTTDDDGLAVFPSGTDAGSQRIVAITDDHGMAVAESPLSGAAHQGGDQLFVFTERPIYRPGQIVYWKLFARRAEGEGYALPDHASATLKLNGPDDHVIELGSAALSASGAADGSTTIPADAPLGDWSLAAEVGHASGSAALAIQEYRKPEYKVDVTPDHETYVNGDEVRFNVAASYFFGAPVVGAKVRYTLFESRLNDEARWDLDGEGGAEGEGERSAGYGRMLESGETRTDVDGRVSLAFTPQRVAYDRRLALEVEVVDASQRTVSGRGSAIVGRGLFSLQLKPLAQMFLAGQPLQVDVQTLDHTGKPVSAAVTVELDQDVWNPLERRYTRSSRPLASQTGTTSSLRGGLRATLVPAVARSGYLIVRAHADDARGNRITAETSFWVFDSKVWEYAYRYPSLEALPDKDHYAPGDTANLLVNTDQRDAAVLVCVEGRELHEHRVQNLFGNTGLVRVPIRREYAPNVFVALHVRRGREVHSRMVELAVHAGRHDLAITLTPDKPQYRPQDKATFTVETRDGGGAPVSAEVALGVVDEAIYALKADATPDPRDVFYGKRPDWVTTVVSFPTLYYGGADKGDHDEPRRDFRDVALWAPTVRTGADGRAQVSLQYPDNLTTWRATARGLTDATLVGTAVTKTLVTKDIVARLAVPRAFTAGDEATLVSVTTNRSATPQTGVSEALEVSGAARLAGPGSATTSMAKGGESRGAWRVAIAAESPRDGSEGSVKFTFRARAKADADALEQVVPVQPRAVALNPHGAGSVAGGAGTVTVTLPAELIRSGSRVTLELSGSPAALALSATEYLAGYPYGCTEQTSDAILAATALLAAARQGQQTVPGWDDPAKRLTPALEHLQSLRSGDGGWSWWSNGEPDADMSVLAVDALAQSAALDVQKDECLGAIEQAQVGVLRLVQEVRSVDGEAYAAAHLASLFAVPGSEARFADLRALTDALARGCYDQRTRLGNAGLGYAALACSRTHHEVEARALLDALMKHATTDAAGLSLPADEAGGWYGEGAENTAVALQALSVITPADPRAQELVRWLASERTGRDWRTTRTTGVAAVALAAYLGAHPAEMQAPARVSARWNGASVFDGALGAAGAFAAGTSVTIAGAQLKPGANTLELSREGGGTLHWSWTARANVPSPGPATLDPRLAVRREYRHASLTADRRGRPRWLTSPVTAQDPLRVGEAVLVRLTLVAKDPLERVMLEDPKPAGFEIDQVLPDGVDRPWDTWAESRDDRAVFFLGRIDAGETALEYILRPELSGAFTALPASAGPMYDPDLLVRGPEARLSVVSPP